MFSPEIVDPLTDEVLPDGERGELVLTSLTKVAMPIVRYRTRDLTLGWPERGHRGRRGSGMQVAELLADGFERVAEVVRPVLDGVGPDELAWRPEGEGNSIGWLVWHLTRVQDDHVADAFGREQLWLDDEWVVRFSLALQARDTGYGHSSDEVSGVRIASAALLTGYFEAVHARTLQDVGRLTEAALERIVDTSWDPPVTLGVRLLSVISDGLQHAGQAGYVRGLLKRLAQ